VSLEDKGKEQVNDVNSDKTVKEALKGEKGEGASDTEEEEEEEVLHLEEEEKDKDSQEERDTTGGDVAEPEGEPEGGGAKARKISKRVSKMATLTVSTDQIESGPQTRTRAKVADAQTGVSTRAKRKRNGRDIGNEGPQKKRRAAVKKGSR
jgi:hypothetical protein